MTRYRSRPASVEALQWRGNNEAEVMRFFQDGTRYVWGESVVALQPDGVNVRVDYLEWLVRYTDGWLALFHDDVFKTHFEPEGE